MYTGWILDITPHPHRSTHTEGRGGSKPCRHGPPRVPGDPGCHRSRCCRCCCRCYGRCCCRCCCRCYGRCCCRCYGRRCCRKDPGRGAETDLRRPALLHRQEHRSPLPDAFPRAAHAGVKPNRRPVQVGGPARGAASIRPSEPFPGIEDLRWVCGLEVRGSAVGLRPGLSVQ